MRSITSNRVSRAPLALLLLGGLSLGCSDDEPAPSSNLKWFSTCGDPVCSGYNPQGTRVCDTEAEAAACATGGDTCAIVDNDCNARLICTDEDPTSQPNGCPISRAAYKRDIHYVTAEERAALAQQALAIPLATYRYKTQTDARTNLGFIIEDVEPSPAVRSEANHVDLYGYSSMMLAALQTQQAELTVMRAELAALREELAALRRRKR